MSSITRLNHSPIIFHLHGTDQLSVHVPCLQWPLLHVFTCMCVTAKSSLSSALFLILHNITMLAISVGQLAEAGSLLLLILEPLQQYYKPPTWPWARTRSAPVHSSHEPGWTTLPSAGSHPHLPLQNTPALNTRTVHTGTEHMHSTSSCRLSGKSWWTWSM